MPLRSKIGVILFCPVCQSVLLFETLTLQKTFEQEVLKLDISYEYFLWLDLSVGTIIIYPVTLTLEFDPFLKILTLVITFEKWGLELRYLTWIFPVVRPFLGYHYFFYPVTLTLKFNPLFKNFNLAYNFWTVSARALIFHMSSPCDKTFLLVLNLLTPK